MHKHGALVIVYAVLEISQKNMLRHTVLTKVILVRRSCNLFRQMSVISNIKLICEYVAYCKYTYSMYIRIYVQ